MSAELFDTHCHLTFKDLAGRADEVIAAAAMEGVTRILTVACTPADFEPALALQTRHERLWVAAGIHPHEAGNVGDDDFKRLADMWRASDRAMAANDTDPPAVRSRERPSDARRTIAAGEMGLDYHYDFSPRDVQAAVFERQLAMLADSPPPIIIHCREAHEDVVRILLRCGYGGRRVVFHCFSGTAEQAAELRSHGWWTSFTGVVTFKNAADMQRACCETPADQLMFETDAPYLSPEPVRKLRPNEPRYLVHTVKFAATLRGTTFGALARATTENAVHFFRLGRIC